MWLASVKEKESFTCGLLVYGTARFKLHTRECIIRVYLVTPVEYIRKSRVFEDTCTENLQALHARLWS